MFAQQQILCTIFFAAIMLGVSLYGLALSGHFPAEFRDQTLKSAAGTALLGASAIAALAALALGLFAAWPRLPWFMLVIGGGAGVLLAPLVLAAFSDRFVDGRGALIVFPAGAIALAVVLSQL